MLPYAPSKIVRGVNQNDPEINRWLFHFYYPIVEREIMQHVGNIQDLDDLINTVFAKFWSHKKPFKIFKNIRDYMHKSIYHTWDDYLKEQKENKNNSFAITDFDLSGLTEEPLSEEDSYMMEQIYRKIEELPGKTKEVFLLYCKEHLSDEDIAKKTRITVKTVKNKKSEALRLLKLELRAKKSAMPFPVILLLIKLLYDRF